jgi:hypothetical protein
MTQHILTYTDYSTLLHTITSYDITEDLVPFIRYDVLRLTRS